MPKFNTLTAFTCAGRGGQCATGMALKRDIELNIDAEGEIAREQVWGET